MVTQVEFSLMSKRRGFHLVTDEILMNLPRLPSVGILNLFIKHTSAALTLNENADPDVRTDLEAIFNNWCVKENLFTNIKWRVMMICLLMLKQLLPE